MEERAERNAESSILEAEIAEACGVLNATTGRLVQSSQGARHRGLAGGGHSLFASMGGLAVRRVSGPES